MSEKHTPGPWKRHVFVDGSVGVISGNQTICQFSHLEGAGRNIAEADGRLIVAAPDLLKALIGLVDAADETRITYRDIDTARDAIAKATGNPA